MKKRPALKPDPVAHPRISWLIALVLALIFGALSHWKVFEYDLFFNVRWGKEVWESGKVQTTDTWSHTVFGQPCYNFEWLSTVATYLGSLAQSDYAFLGWLRSFLVGFWVWGLTRLLQIGFPRSIFSAWIAPLILIPLLYVMCSFRLQMRPDLFATAHYIGLLLLWYSEGFKILTRRKISLAILLSWANFHAGTVPIGIFFYSAMVAFVPTEGSEATEEESWPKKLGWIGAGVACWFLTPIGFAPISILLETTLHYDHALWGNPDFQPLSAELFEFNRGGWSFYLWAFYCGLVALSYLYLLAEKPLAIPRLLRHRWVLLIVGGALTLQMFNKIRIIHYQVAFFLPLISAAFGTWTENGAWRARRASLGFLSFLALLLWAFILPDQTNFIAKPLGRGVTDTRIPVQSVAFIKMIKPERNLLNPYPQGGYLIAELPEYPVFIDGRGPYGPLLAELNQAKNSAAAYAQFLRKYSINVALETLPSTQYDPQKGFVDSHQTEYPPQEWALVFMDNASVVYVRRIPQHELIIKNYAYHFIRRGLPAAYGATYQGLSDSERQGYEAEFDRCLAQMSNNTYCLFGKAAFFQSRKDLLSARKTLEVALNADPENPEVYFTLSELYQSLGMVNEAKKMRARFARLTQSELSFLAF